MVINNEHEHLVRARPHSQVLLVPGPALGYAQGCSWVLPRYVLSFKGLVQFSVCFSEVRAYTAHIIGLHVSDLIPDTYSLGRSLHQNLQKLHTLDYKRRQATTKTKGKTLQESKKDRKLDQLSSDPKRNKKKSSEG